MDADDILEGSRRQAQVGDFGAAHLRPRRGELEPGSGTHIETPKDGLRIHKQHGKKSGQRITMPWIIP